MLVCARISPIKLFILLICFLQPLYSEEQASKSITFFDLESPANLDGQSVAIRGFLYESPEGQMILAAEPNLKSCCVGSASKRQRQLVVMGDIDPQTVGGNAVTLRGNIVVAMGESFPFRLETAQVAPMKDQCYWVLGMVGVGLALISGAIFFLLRKKTR